MQQHYIPTEDTEQAHIFAWAAWASGKYPELDLMHHIPNGGKRSKSEAARFKAQGVKAGVPDIFLPCARGGYHGLYIELKRTKGGKLSAAQKEWIDALRGQDYKVIVCYGFDEAREVIINYLEGAK